MTLQVFTIPHCRECQAVKEFLRQRGVDFLELDVANNFANLRRLRRYSDGRRVPVTVFGAEVVVGYDPEALASLVAKKEDPDHGAGD